MSHRQDKIFRINWIMHRINVTCNQGKDVSEEKLLAEFCLFFGAARRYAIENLKDLETTGRIFRKDGMIFTPEAWQEERALEKLEKTNKEFIKEAEK